MDKEKTPQCVGFIMDGNRRWAKAQGIPSLEGHMKGYETLKNLINTMYAKKIPHMVCYAFSTENWNRTEKEVEYFMNLLQQAIKELPGILKKEQKDVAIRFIGERTRLSTDIQKSIVEVESHNTHTPDLTVWIALSYGGRAEIVDAVNRAVKIGERVTEDAFEKLLWTEGMPDPDIIIRTSGEYRISNFLLWQSAYAEFFFSDTLWPDFGESELGSILEQYATRQRRRGV